MKTSTEQSSCKWNSQRLLILICATLVSSLSYGQTGNAPMQQLPAFPGPFAIDGYLQRQGASGDWLAPAGTNSGINRVFTDAGLPAPLIKFSFLKRDLFDDQTNDEIFTQGAKLNDNPNDWHWRSSKPPQKDDINNSMGFLALNPANQHIWLAISGDRLATNGTSYIDFEFSQNEITRTGGPIPGGSGGFISAGPHNGRTVGDIDLTLEFTGGGSFATIKYLQWQPGAEAGSFDYFPIIPAPGTAFAAANSDETPINVPYGAFGGTTYTRLQFVEGAIDISALIGGSGLPGECGSQPFESLFIKTKSSASSTAELKDFIAPFSLNTCFDETPPVITCPQPIVLGCNPTIPGPSGATASDNCNGVLIPVSADGPVQSSGCSRTMTRVWRATDACGNAATCGQLITWTEDNTAPVITTSSGSTSIGCNPSQGDINGALGTASASDGCGGSPTLSAPTDGSVISVGCSRSQTRSWTARDACGNTATAARTVTWTADNTAPGFTGDYSDVTLTCNVTEWIGSLGTATATDACGTPTITSSDGPVVTNDCNRSITRIFTARDGCNNTATISRTVRWKAVLTNPIITVGGLAITGTTEFNLGCNPPDVSINATLGTANATNGCANVSVNAVDAPTVTNNCERVRVRTFTATDDCGHLVTAARLVRWIVNNAGPQISTFSAPPDLGCNPSANDIDAALGTITATDACANVTITSSDGPTQSDGCSRARTRTFTATGGCGNTATASRTVTWKSDNTPAVFTGSYADVNLGCNPANPDGSLGSASATDVCGAVTITQSDGAVQSNGCNRSRTRTFTAIDGCLNTSTTSRTVRWISDNTPAAFTGSYADVNLGCNPGNPDGSLGTATATDVCGAVTITQSDGAVVSTGCNRSRTRTFTATDGCLNTSTTSRTVRWISDNTPATFTGSYADVNLGCNPANPDGSLGSASATDVCGAVTITQSDGAVVSDGCNRSRTRTFTATDGCLNTSTTSRTVRWISDNTPAAFTGSYADVNLGCNPANPDGSLGSASATDVCGAVTITQSDGVVVSTGCNRARTRTFTATDGCLNTSTTSRTVRWISDLTPAAFTGSYADVNLGCNPANPDGSLGSASATDVCGAVTITQSDGAVVSDGCNRARTRTFTATDGCLNTSTTSRTVRWISDLTPAAFTGSYADVNLGCNPANPDGSLGSASATDVCGAVTITQSDGAVQSNGCNRSRTRTFTATDGCLNTSTTSRTVRWISDLTPAAFTGSYADVNLGCNPANPDGSLGSASATDVCGAVTITQSDGAVVSDGCNRARTRTFTATDGCLNTSTTSRTVRWISDLTPAAFTGSYADVNLGCNPANPDGSLGSASATDVCGAVTITQSDGAVVSTGCNRSRTRTFTATDGCLNTSTTSRTVRWISDNTPATFTGSFADVNLGCNPANPDGSLGSANATDACGSTTVTQSDGALSSDGCNRARTRTFTANDGCGNTASTSRTVRWTVDNAPPAFTGSYADVNLGCNPADPDGSLGTATATDGCGAVTITPSDGAVQSNGCNRSRTRTFTARDGCNNTATTSRTVRWISDNTPAAFTGSYADVNLGCNPGNPDGSLGTATATDGCGAVTITSSDGAVVSNGCNRSRTRTFTATDGCLNTSTTSRTVRWVSDNTPPVFTGDYSDVNLGCNPGNPDGSLGTATATDGCGAVTITSSDGAVQSSGCNRSRTRTFTATDGCLNTATTSRTVRWTSDNTPPAFTGTYTDVNLGCNPANPDGSLGTATATDGCGAVTITSSDGAVVSDGCNRSRTRTFTATDGCLNTSTTSRTVRWISDNTPAAFTGSYADVNLGCNPANPDGSLGTATASDVCGAVTITSSDGAVVSTGCNRSRTRTFTATDGCLNTSTTSRTVRWISDNTPATFTGSYADVNLGCNPANPDGSLGSASATDVCGAVTITQSDGAVVSDGCNRSRTRTFTATDGCLNTSTTSRTVRWISDNTPAAFTGSYADVNLGCNPGNPDGSLGTATATDVCGAVTITSSDGAVVSDGCNRSRTRTFTATDGCLNTSTTSRTVRWISDNTPAVFTGSYADVNLGCNPANPDGSLGSASATDVCGAVTITSSDGAVQSNGCNRSRTRTFTATDGCLNTSTTSRTVRWISDNTPAVFTGSYADVNLGCNPANPDGSLGSASATDVCGAVTITQSDGAVVSDGCNRSRTRTFTATDGCLNTSTTSRTVRWISDNTPAAFTGSYADVNLGCNPANPDGSLGSASATDVCGAVTITQSDGAVVSDGCNRSRTRTFTATDGCLNTSTTSRTVRWISDNTPPAFTGSYADVNLGCNPANPDGSLGTATATDVCGAVTITSSDGAVVSDGCNRSRTRTFTATDGCLNTSTTSRTVRWISDNTPPSFTGSYADVNLGCNPANPDGSLGTATATDGCGAVTITSSDGAVVSDGCNRSRTRTFTATDGCLNTSTTSRTVRWISDNTPPAFTGSYADVNLGCNPANPDGSLGTATATDVCGAVTIASSDGAVVSDGCNRSRTRTFTATDGCLNTSTTSRTVRWISDNTPAAFTGSYADVNLGCNPANPDGSLGTATATDVCGAVTITSSDGAVVSNGCNRSRTRTFTATDGCLNTSTTSRTVRWISDNTPPAFTGSYADVNLGCNPGNPDGSLGTATATDGCGDVTITSSDGAVQSSGCNRSRTRTFTATDGCLNTATTSRTVRWISDNTPPAFTGSYADVNLGCNPANPDGSLGTATATDVCGAVTITSSDGAVVSDGCNRARTRTFTATDGCLNTSTTSRTVRWISDNTPAAFTGSYADVNLGCNPANPDGSLGTATATDVCGAVTITSSDGAVVSDGCNRSRTRTFTATDGCLNTSTTSRTVRWISDNTPAAFTGSYADVNLGCNPANPDGSLGTATATDVCGAVTITSSDGAVVSDGCNRSRTRTFTATDGCLNTSTTSRTVRWISDNTPAAFTGSYADVNLGCNPANPDGSLGTATATDVCGAVTITSSDGAVQSSGCNRSRTRTFTATDGCLNTSTTSRTVRWISDNTPAAFTGSYADVNLGCNPANPDGSLGTATATDICGAVTITSSDGAVVSDGCNRSRTRTFTATDGCLNTSTTSRTVRWISDNTPAAFTGSYADVNLGCNPANPDGSLGTATATDVCGAVTITQSDGAVVSDGCNRARTRTFTATDGCLNTSTTSRTVRWISDLTPAAFTGSYADVNLGCNPANPDGSLGSASATDVCGAVTITQSDGAVVSTGCNRSRTRTFTATDGCLNTSTTSRTVRWISDLTPAAFTGSYADVNLGCNPANPDGSLGSASATDVCGAVTITQSDGAVVSDGCNRARTRTFTATDGCLNTSTTSRTVRWISDNTPAAFTGSYADVNLGCNPANPDGSLGSASATDVCGAVTITQSDGAVVSDGCNRSRTRTFTATDGCLNTSTTSRTVRWISDNTPAAFTGSYADVNLGCNPANPDGSLGSASATDVCGAVTITQSDGAVVSTGCNRARTRTFTATDGCLNTSTTSRTVRWISDLTPAAFTGSYADVNLGCNPANPDGSLGSASATDVCGAVTITQSDGAVVSTGCNRSRTRTFTATDGCLNTSTTSRTVRWISDLTPAVFTGSYADVNLGCNPANPDGSLGSASATDVCGAVTITQSDGAVVSDGCNRSRTRTFTATDGCLNTSTTSRTVRWISDNTPPAFTGSYADVNLGCNPANPDGSLGSASATDVCGAVTITQSDGAVVSDGCNRSRTRTFTATDGCLNTSTTSRTVRWISDLTPAAFTGSYADVNLGCNPANPDGSLGSASATDVCGAVTITQSDGAVVSDGCNRSRTRTFTATDGCLNTSTTSRTVRWISDLTPAAFTGSYADVNLGCNPANPDGSLGSASATDVCGAVTITQSDGAVVSDGCNRSRTRTFTATDGCLNTSTTSRTVRWISDLTSAAFTGSYADVNLGCNPANPDGSLGSASATDVCGAVTITQSDGAVVSTGCNRARTRTFTATDGCLNTSTTSRTVRWISDLTPAAFTGSYADVNLGCNPANPDGSLGSASATDVCGAVTITQSDGAVVSDGCNRARTRTFTATDGCLNTSTTSRTVRWISDLTPAAFTGSYADVNLGCNPANPDGSLGSASATDVCGAVTITQSDGAVVSDGCNRARTRTFTATDGCLNTSTTSRTVRWISDLTPAAFTGSYADVNLGCNPANPDGSLGSASATDVCGAVTITQSDGAVVSDGCNRSRTRTFTATDGCLNTSTTSRTVRWISDLTPAAFTGSYADVNLGCNPANPDGSLGSASATDVCGAVTITQSDGAVVSDGCNRARTRTFTATDGCLNTSTTSRTVRWISDLTPAAFTGSYADVNLGCNPANPDGSLGSASATDVCGAVTITQSDGAVVSDGCNRSRTRTFTATDGCLNTSTTSRTVRWISDLTPAAFTGSYADVNLGCNPANPDGSLGSASATDVCGAVTITQSDGAVVSDGCNRSRTRTFTATDGCLNTSTTSRTVRWISDLTPAAFTGSYADVNLGCNPANPDGSLGSASATDVCGAVTITQSDGAVVSTGCNRSRTRTFTATDGCLNTSTTSRTVRWISDLTPAVFTGSYADVNLGCNPANPDGSLGSASATDVCGAVTITQSDGAVVSDGCNRSRTRTFTATDGCLNTSTTSRTVRWISDLTPAAFTGSYADVNLGCNPANPDGSLGSASATDVCGAVTITQSDGAVVSNGCNRARTRTFTATDGCLNTSTTSRTVRWISDLTPAAFTGSYADVNLGCNPANPDGSLGSASATDVCGAVTITQSDGAVVSDGCNRARTRTFTATDGCLNTSTTSRTVRWISDLTPAAFTGSYADVNLGCNPANPDGSLGSASATDVCGAVTITQSDGAVVSTGCNRARTRTFTATDGCLNTSTTSRTVRWISDATPPAFTGSYANVNLGCNPANPGGSLGTATATDGCGAVTITTADGPVVSNECLRSQTRTFTARDACGNISTASRTVTWTEDRTPPTIICPADKVIDASEIEPSNCEDLGGGGVATVVEHNDNLPPVGNNKVDFRQPRNEGHPAVPLYWTNGVDNLTQSEYFEGMGVPQRIIFTQLQGTTHTFRFRHEAVKHQSGDRHAYDFMMSWEQAIATAANIGNGSVNELQNLIAQTCNEGISATAGNACGDLSAIPVADPRVKFVSLPDNMGNPPNHHGNRSVNDAIACFESKYGDRKIEIRGDAPITSFNIVFEGYSGRDDGDNYAWYTITWTSTAKEVMIKLAGRAAAGAGSCGYGACFGAGSINGAPYHFKLDKLDDHSLGDRDNQVRVEKICTFDVPFTFGTPTVTDCDPNPTLQIINSDVVTTNPDGSKTHTRTWKATDACGNTATCSQNVNIICSNGGIENGRQSAGGGSGRVITSNSTSSQPSLIVTAFPNPYEENFSLKINSPVTGLAMISFYTMDGVKVGEMKRDVVAFKDVWVPYNVPAVYRTRIVYTVSVAGYNARGIVLSPN